LGEISFQLFALNALAFFLTERGGIGTGVEGMLMSYIRPAKGVHLYAVLATNLNTYSEPRCLP
jgi:hypothetical protein